MNETQDFRGSSTTATADSNAHDGSGGQIAVAGSEIDVGDLFVIAAVAEFGVEWLVVEKAAGRCLVVPVDMAPMVGSRDVSLEDATGEPMTARGGHSLWLPTHALEPQHLTASLGPAAAAAVSQTLTTVMNGEPQQSSGLEVDTESAYVEWDLRLTAARSNLAHQWPALDASSPAADSMPGSHGEQNLASPAGRDAVVIPDGLATNPGSTTPQPAIGLMLAAILALTCLAAWQQFRIRSLSATPSLTANVPVFALSGEPVRGPKESIVWPTEAQQLMLLLSFYDPQEHDFYRLELSTETRQDGPWELEGLRRLAFREITVTMTRDLLRNGRYRLDLSGSDPEKPPFVQSFTFEVTSE